jgi:hypothetical protein
MVTQVGRSKLIGIIIRDDGDVFNAVQVLKRLAGRVVIPIGIDSKVNAVQPMNTVLSAIVKSPVGSKMDVRVVLPLNVLLFNIVTCVADKSADTKEVQPLNADAPMIVTPEGMIKEVRVIQPWKSELPIDKSPEGRLVDVKDVQSRNELASIVVTPVADISIVSRSVELWKTSAFIAVTLAPRVTLAGIGPVKPVSTPFTMIG